MKNKKRELIQEFIKKYWPLSLVAIFKNTFIQYVNIYIVGIVSLATDAILNRDINTIKSNLISLIFAVIAVVVVFPLIDYFSKKAWVYLGVKFDSSMYNKFTRQKRKVLDEQENGELVYRVENDPLDYRGNIHDIIVEFSVLVLVVVQSLYLMLPIHFLFAVICLFLSILPGLMPFITKEWIQKFFKNEKESLGEIGNHEKKLVENFPYTRVYSLKEKVLCSLDEVYNRYFKEVFRKKASLERGINSLNSFFTLICQVVIYIIGSYLIAKGAITVGQAVKFFGLSFVLKDSTEYLIYGLKACYQLNAAAERILELVGDEEVSGQVELTNIESVDLKDLSFSYGDRSILDRINLSIKKGEHVVLKGGNGSGKTTLIKLLTGLYDNYNGSIEFNGIPLNGINLESLRDQVTLISQVPFLFNTTVYENVAMAREEAKPEEINDIINKLDLYEIKDKKVGENGAYLSGGQRQRISIARALLRDTSVVILDEPDNSLDFEGNKWIRGIFKDTDKTVIVITHNNSWGELSNKVYSLS